MVGLGCFVGQHEYLAHIHKFEWLMHASPTARGVQSEDLFCYQEYCLVSSSKAPIVSSCRDDAGENSRCWIVGKRIWSYVKLK